MPRMRATVETNHASYLVRGRGRGRVRVRGRVRGRGRVRVRVSYYRAPTRLWRYVENKLARATASWLSGGFPHRHITPQAAPSSGQPRPISLLSRTGRPVSNRAQIGLCLQQRSEP